jgi:hypothetical protein
VQIEEEKPDSASHNFAMQIDEDARIQAVATCTTDVAYYLSCTRCFAQSHNDADIFTVPNTALGHDFSRQAELNDGRRKTAPTCTTDAEYYYSCEHCDDEWSKVASFTVTNSNLQHAFTERILPGRIKDHATCLDDAVYYFSCAHCNESSKDITNATFVVDGSATGHDFTREWADDSRIPAWIIPSCDSDKTYFISCKNCDDYFDTENFFTAQNSASGHDFALESVDIDRLKSYATCISDAVYYLTCTRCGSPSTGITGETFAHTQPNPDGLGLRLGHAFTKEEIGAGTLKAEATCFSGDIHFKTCIRCPVISENENEIFVDDSTILSHLFTESIVESGKIRTQPTCLTDATYYLTCELCMQAHSDTEFFVDTASRLGHEFGAEIVNPDRRKDLATCLTGAIYYKTCLRCINVFSTLAEDIFEDTANALGHSFTIDIVNANRLKDPATCLTDETYYKTCVRCDEFSNNNAEIFVSVNTRLGHSLVWVNDTLATCLTDQIKHYNCNRVNCHTDIDEIMFNSRLGHMFNNWEITHSPTCTHDGLQARSCQRGDCGHFEQQSASKTGHDAGAWHTIKATSCTENGLQELRCTKCEHLLETATVNATGHNYSNCGDKCTACNTEYICNACTRCVAKCANCGIACESTCTVCYRQYICGLNSCLDCHYQCLAGVVCNGFCRYCNVAFNCGITCCLVCENYCSNIYCDACNPACSKLNCECTCQRSDCPHAKCGDVYCDLCNPKCELRVCVCLRGDCIYCKHCLDDGCLACSPELFCPVCSSYTSCECTAPAINDLSLADGEYGKTYSQAVSASGTNVNFRIINGNLPYGLTLGAISNGTSYISGTVALAGSFTFTIEAYNAKGSHSVTLTLFIAKSNLTVALNDITIKEGETPVFSFVATGLLFNDIFEEVVTGITVLQPIPTQPGIYTLHIFGGVAANYHITHQSGKLTIERNHIGFENGDFVIEGAFDPSLGLQISEITRHTFNEQSGYTANVNIGASSRFMQIATDGDPRLLANGFLVTVKLNSTSATLNNTVVVAFTGEDVVYINDFTISEDGGYLTFTAFNTGSYAVIHVVPNSNGGGSGINVGLIVGASIGGTIGAVVLGVVIFMIIRKKMKGNWIDY